VSADRPVYDLLPAIHRLRDAERGRPLSALLEVVEDELTRLTGDVDGLYDDWFVETCADWVVPYLGDLLGVHGLRTAPGAAGLRALVANTIRYRRRKGTPGVIQQVARDVTGWPARVVEYYRLLGATQHLDHVRPDAARTADLRDADGLALAGTAFDPTARTAELRHIDIGRGRYNIPDIGVHLWRLAAYPVERVSAGRVGSGWTFDPAGRDLQLFHRARTEPAEGADPAAEVDVPGPLRRRALARELATGSPVFLAEPAPTLRIRFGDDAQPVSRLVVRDLTDWAAPEDGPGQQRRIAVDPVLGRITLSPGLPSDDESPDVRVDYAYGFPGDVGAGPHDRRATLAAALEIGAAPPVVGWSIQVAAAGPVDPGRTVRTVSDALRLWDARPELPPGQVGVIAITDSTTYAEDLDVRLGPGDRLILVAAAWPAPEPGTPAPFLDALAATARGLRPHLTGSVQVTGAAGGELVLDGLSVQGDVAVPDGDLGRLTVSDSTLLAAPDGTGGRITVTGNPHLAVRLIRDVLAGADLGGAPALSLTDTLLYDTGRALDAAGARTDIDGCTVFGTVDARILTAGNSILYGHVEARHVQEGCVRFSYLPADSRVPRRYRCQPAGDGAPVLPTFTSMRPVDPGFGQLAVGCPAQITNGADDEGEMGAYHFLGQPVRMANLASQLEVYLRFGLEAGVFFAT
jgi:Phage tail protein (Tail_P2_I)